jgi:hypothetical protein
MSPFQHSLRNTWATNERAPPAQGLHKRVHFICVPLSTVVSEYMRSTGSVTHRRTATLNGFEAPWKEAHELLPLTN